MLRARPSPAETADTAELRESIRVLTAVIGALAERIEILEAREALSRAGARVHQP